MKAQKSTLTVTTFTLFKFGQQKGADGFHTTHPTTITIGTNTGTLTKTTTSFQGDHDHAENGSFSKVDR